MGPVSQGTSALCIQCTVDAFVSISLIIATIFTQM